MPDRPAIPDAVDGIRVQLASIHPNLDTTGFGVTGRVLRLAQTLEALRAEHLQAFGLVPGDFDVLATIRRTEGDSGVNPSSLLASVLITSGGLTKRLDRLVAAGWVSRHPDPDDRRATRITLTVDGRELIDQALPSLLASEHERMTSALSNRQLDQVTAGLRQLILGLDAR